MRTRNGRRLTDGLLAEIRHIRARPHNRHTCARRATVCSFRGEDALIDDDSVQQGRLDNAAGLV